MARSYPYHHSTLAYQPLRCVIFSQHLPCVLTQVETTMLRKLTGMTVFAAAVVGKTKCFGRAFTMIDKSANYAGKRFFWFLQTGSGCRVSTRLWPKNIFKIGMICSGAARWVWKQFDRHAEQLFELRAQNTFTSARHSLLIMIAGWAKPYERHRLLRDIGNTISAADFSSPAFVR